MRLWKKQKLYNKILKADQMYHANHPLCYWLSSNERVNQFRNCHSKQFALMSVEIAHETHAKQNNLLDHPVNGVYTFLFIA